MRPVDWHHSGQSFVYRGHDVFYCLAGSGESSFFAMRIRFTEVAVTGTEPPISDLRTELWIFRRVTSRGMMKSNESEVRWLRGHSLH